MKRISISILLLFAFLTGCTVSLIEWLPEAYATADVDALLGEWRLTEVKGVTNKLTAFEIQVKRKTDGQFVFLMREPENPKLNTFSHPSELRFYRINADLYVMATSAERTPVSTGKSIYRIVQEDNGQRFTVLVVSEPSAIQDIRDGKVNGRIGRLDSNSPEFCTITATSAELAEYLSTAKFVESFVFSKVILTP